MNEQSEKKTPAKKTHNRPAYIRNVTTRTRDRPLRTPMAMLAGLVVWATPLLLPNAGLTASATIQTAPQGLNAWKSSSPQEAVWALGLDPINPKVIYAGAKSGVFKSTDGGSSWKKSGLMYVSALAIDYVNPNTIYAGAVATGLVFAPGKPSMFKSTDGGLMWSDVGVVDFDISLLVMDPNSSTTLYAGSLFRYQEEGGIILWKTTNGGVSWNDLRNQRVGPSGLLGLSTYGWAISPAQPQAIYASGILYLPSLDFEPGMFKSMDSGTSWNSTGLKSTLPSAVVIDPSNPGTLYAGTVTNGFNDLTFRGLLKSTDAGENWFAINNGLSHLIGTSSYLTSLVLDPVEPNILYAGTLGHGVFRSSDGGTSWSQFKLGLTNLDINALAIDPTGKHLYAATNLGVFYYQFATPCADPLSPADLLFDFSGGTGLVNVSALSDCDWTAASHADWISITSDSHRSGNGTVTYSVSPNECTAPRIGLIGIAARFLTLTQRGAPIRINGATVSGKKLLVIGENFDPGAVILLNGLDQKTKNERQTPRTALIGKKVGKKIKPGDRLQVRNPNGALSEEFTFPFY